MQDFIALLRAILDANPYPNAKPNQIVALFLNRKAKKSDIDDMTGVKNEELSLRAVKLAPNSADAYAQSAANLTTAGLHKKALEYIRIAKKLNPHYSYIYLYIEALALFYQHRFEEALPLTEDAAGRNPEFDRMQLLLASTLGHLGKQEAAEWALIEAETLTPSLSLENELENHPWAKLQDRELYVEGLFKAGLSKNF